MLYAYAARFNISENLRNFKKILELNKATGC